MARRRSAFDVAVLGGGPAGAAAALALSASGRSVAIVERSRYEAPRIGETVPPDCGVLLQELGVWQAFVDDGHETSYGTMSCWGDERPGFNDFIFSPFGRGWHLDRRRFDALLARRAAERGASLHTASRVSRVRRLRDGRWRLTLETAGRTLRPLTVSMVIDASGRGARFALARGARKLLYDRLVGVSVLFSVDAAAVSHAGRTLIEAVQDGWWYSAYLPDDRMVVAYMSDADLVKSSRLKEPRRWRRLLRSTRYTRDRVRLARATTRPVVRSAHTHRLDRASGDGWLAVGDAAVGLDPLSSHGITSALRSGLEAATAIVESSGSRRASAGLEGYGGHLAATFDAYLETRAAYYGREGRWAERPFWQRRRTPKPEQKGPT